LGFGRSGDTGGDALAADPAASSRDLFFPSIVFMFFDGEGFILQCTWFSLAFARGLRRWLPAAARLDLQSPLRWKCAQAVDSRNDLLGMAASAWGKKP
jgi:hypothetical protein